MWDGASDADLSKLDQLQKDAARIVTGATARCPTGPLMDDVAWPRLATRRRAHKLTMFHKMVNGLSPPYLSQLLPERNGQRVRYRLREPDNYPVPLSRTMTLSKSYLPSTISIWNSLDARLKTAQTLQYFKQQLLAPNITNKLFYVGPRWCSVILSRIRIGCSGLKAHLHHNLHVEPSAACNCGHQNEDPRHFFFECTQYTLQRQALFQILDQASTTLDTIMYGDQILPYQENVIRLHAIHKYILDTGRFPIR